MVKAKAKADRTATRLAQANTQSQQMATIVDHSLTASTTDDPLSSTTQDSNSQETEDNAESAALPNMDAISTPSRTELLRSKPDVVDRFMQLLVPILVDVYAASVSIPIRTKSLTGILKTVGFLDADGLKRVFTVCICAPSLYAM